MPTPDPDVGDRYRYSPDLMVAGAGCGCLFSFLLLAWMLPVSEILHHPQAVLRTIIWCGMGTALGAMFGWWLLRTRTSSAGGRAVRIRWLVGGLLAGLVLSCVLILVMLIQDYFIRAPVGLGGALPLVVVGFTLLGVGTGCFYGLMLGDKVAMKLEAEEQERIQARLDAQRRALENALAEKFGSLEDALRERIRLWDEGRVAEAMRRLPDASSLDDLE